MGTPHEGNALAQRLANGFAERLAPHFVLAHLETHPTNISGLFADGEIAYVNPAWVRFASENGELSPALTRAWLGQRYLDVIAAPFQPFYTRLFALASEVGSALQPLSHVYECSTASVFRQFAMTVYALPQGRGYVVINTLVAARPHDLQARVPQPPDASLYASSNGIITQCAHCRMVRRADHSQWDWVPAYVARAPVGLSHGACGVCLDYYYPDGA